MKKSRKTSKKVRLKRGAKKRIIKVDISDWCLDDWPEALAEAIEVDARSYGVDISINYALMEPIARKIIKEGIETFLRDARFEVTDKGLIIMDLNFELTDAVIPFSEITCYSREAQKRINEDWDNWFKQNEAEQELLQGLQGSEQD